ncbi:MAG: 37S ribosomal protein, mitochondrial [Lichina confinis]|nr:MAG: 37S ribosomal protein, mitochondrial [Lichina confinis]
MIIRPTALRQGSKALITQTSSLWRRKLATEGSRDNGPASTLLADNADATTAILQSMLAESVQSQSEPSWAKGPGVKQQHVAEQKLKRREQEIGGVVAPYYKPKELLRDPPGPKDVTLELLLASQSHMGHATSLWNPANQRYIFGIRGGIHIISLDATAAYLRRAAKVVRGVAERGGLTLFVGTRKGQSHAVVNAARLADGCHLFERWIPGSITNGEQILGACGRKVVDEFDREVPGFDELLRDEPVIRPDLVVCFNPLENYVMLHECAINHIPTIGVIDTNANPAWVTYPIPANDDSLRCIQVIAGVLGKAGQAGQQLRREAAEEGEVTFTPYQWRARPSEGAAKRKAQF